MTTQKERWDAMLDQFKKDNDTLEASVRSFLKLLDTKEEDGVGELFNPTYILSCRAQHTAKLEIILDTMRSLTEGMDE